MRIAIIGSGISGLGCAWLLSRGHTVTLYEANTRLGGHSSTVDLPWQGRDIPVDTGFIVYNERNYPNLTRLFDVLDVPTHESDMSFAVSIDEGRLEYAGSSPTTLFAQKGNLLRPAFFGMIGDILRFNREGLAFLESEASDHLTLGAFLHERGYGDRFRRHYLLPMGAAIWSMSLNSMLNFPARTFLRFFANHGLLTLNDRPQWRTVTGGSRVYVERIASSLGSGIRSGTPVSAVRRTNDGAHVIDARGECERFDHVVLACHADQALAILDRSTAAERSILGSFSYRSNRAVLHRDPMLMPRRAGVWSSWNYITRSDQQDDANVSVTYWLNRLQGIDPECLALVSLNPIREPSPQMVVREFMYDHPQYTAGAIAAQRRLAEIQGCDRIWFCGAHWGYGFHEDGLRSGFEVAAALGVPPSWWPRRITPVQQPGTARAMPLPAAAGPA